MLLHTFERMLAGPVSTPAQLTADQNAYAFPPAVTSSTETVTGNDEVSFQRLSSDATRTINGIVAKGHSFFYLVANVGTNAIVLADESSSASAANRIITGSGASLTIGPGSVCILVYDGVGLRWRVVTPGGPGNQGASAWINVRSFGAKGDNSTDDTAAIQAAVNAAVAAGGAVVYLPHPPGGGYKISATIRVASKITIIGDGTADTTGTRVRMVDNTLPAFDSDPNDYLSHFKMADMQIIGPYAFGAANTGDGLRFYGLVNTSRLERLLVRNFSRHGVFIQKQSLNPSDESTAWTVHFDEMYVINCGEYAFRIDGWISSTWTNPATGNCKLGAFYLSGASANHASTIINLDWEKSSLGSDFPIKLDNYGGAQLTLIGGQFISAGTDIVTISGASGARVNLIGCASSAGQFTNWVNDAVEGLTLAASQRVNRIGRDVNLGPTTVEDTSPLLQIRDIDGTANQRIFRWAISGTTLALRAINDAGASQRDLMTTTFAGATTIPGQIHVHEDHTTGDTLTSIESGSDHTNGGAGGSVALTLPGAAAGLHFKFFVMAAQTLTITAASGDVIRIAGNASSSGGTASNNVVGSTIHLAAMDATNWLAVNAPNGTWTLA
jgi:pectate lyase-like protein